MKIINLSFLIFSNNSYKYSISKISFLLICISFKLLLAFGLEIHGYWINKEKGNKYIDSGVTRPWKVGGGGGQMPGAREGERSPLSGPPLRSLTKTECSAAPAEGGPACGRVQRGHRPRARDRGAVDRRSPRAAFVLYRLDRGGAAALPAIGGDGKNAGDGTGRTCPAHRV